MNYVQNNHSFVHFDGIVNHLPESLTMGRTVFEWPGGASSAREIEILSQEMVRYVEEDVHDGATTALAVG